MMPTEINALVARKLGWVSNDYPSGEGIDWTRPDGARISPINMPDYSGSIAAAWEIWEKMSERYFLTLETEAGKFGRHIVKVWKNDKTGAEWMIEDVYADTAPLAICLAFLKLEE